MRDKNYIIMKQKILGMIDKLIEDNKKVPHNFNDEKLKILSRQHVE